MSSDAALRVLYGLVATAHLALNFSRSHPWDVITKCLLAPTLLARSASSAHAPPKLSAALAFCLFGDVFLELTRAPGDLWFLGGMAYFAAAHVYFVILLRPKATLPRAAAAALPVAALAYVLVVRTWTGLEEDLRLPVCAYAVLLGATAVTALAGGNTKASAGALLFLLSDALILLDVAKDPLTPDQPWFWIMLTYASAIFFLSEGILSAGRGAVPAATTKRD